MRLLLVSALVASALGAGWRSDFPVDPNLLGPSGSNPYFVLTPGHTLHFTEGSTRRTITVLAQTEIIDGVECRVVEDREVKNGKPVEVTRDFFAIDRASGDVYYFGEDVDIYKGGKIVSHKGSWRSGVGDARYGLMMPGALRVGDRFMQERAPKRRRLTVRRSSRLARRWSRRRGPSSARACAIRAPSKKAGTISGMRPESGW